MIIIKTFLYFIYLHNALFLGQVKSLGGNCIRENDLASKL
jgi:hypothetical protein